MGVEIQPNEYHWFAVYTKPRAEKRVNDRLVELGYKTYFPVQTVLRQWSDRKKKLQVPLFTSYVFIFVSLADYEIIRRIDGLVNFVYYLGKPAIIKEEEIVAIERFLKKVADTPVHIEKNDVVKIIEGSMANIIGKVISVHKNKIRLTIEQLGLSLYAEVPKRIVKKINS